MAKRKISPTRKTAGKRSLKIAPNDNLSEGFGDAIPEPYRGTDRFLDVVCWNIRYFHHHDAARVKRVTEVLAALNADILVLEEILEDSLAPVAEGLAKKKAGFYEVAYGTTGGNQRVAVMWDLDWVRSKDDVAELFGKRQVLTKEGKDAFPRLPLLGVFTSLTSPEDAETYPPFDFQIVGLHLKSQRGGGADQRALAADKLRDWLVDDAPKVDADVIMLGDWNEPPDAAAWAPFRKLENEKKALFGKINDKDSISHLMYKNKKDIGSRLDLTAISISTLPQMINPPEVVHWKSLGELLATNPQAKQIKTYIKDISADLSDHMPVVTRFYFTVQD